MQVYKTIKYIRLSYTDDKSVESDSVANQRRLIDDYIARHPEIEVVAEKIDDGYSGVLFDRPAFQEMMRMIEQGEANCVIVKDLSRLGREYIETGRYMRRVFPAYGVRFIAINDNVDTETDAADDLTVSVKNIMNEAYSRDISVKTRSALDVKRRSGDFVGAFTIYGYVKTGDKHKSLEVDEYAAGVVRDIFRKRLEGFSASHIADELNRMGILSPLAYKRKYNADIELLQKAIDEWEERLTDVLENRSERNRWINHFMQFSTMEEIDRRAVMQLIRSIRVIGKDELHIEFNYQDEYKKAVALAEQIAEQAAERKAG